MINLFLLIGCSNFKENNHSLGTSLKIIIFIDKTASIRNNSVPELKKEELLPLIDYISNNGGEIALGSITNISKENLEIVRCNLLPKPIQKRGETAAEFAKRVRKYKNAKKSSESYENLKLYLERIEVRKILDYTNLHGASDITGAMELAQLYLTETDLFFKNDINKVALLVTDGKDNMMRSKLPTKFDGELIIVNRTSHAGILENFKYQNFTNVQSAIRYITNKYK